MNITSTVLKKIRRHITSETHPKIRVWFRGFGEMRRQQVAHFTTELWGAENPGDTVLGVIKILPRIDESGKFIEEEKVGYVSWEPIS